MEKRQITNDEAEIILSYDENHFRDLKAKEIAPAKLSRAVSAFANTAGGELFVGIMEHDDGTRTWAGFGDIEAANGLVQVLEALSPMGNLYSAQFLSATGKEGLVLHLAVRKTREVISATDGTAYVRRGAQNLPVTGEDALKRLHLDKGLSTFEDDTVNVPSDTITNSVTTLEFVLLQVPSAEPDAWLKSQFVLTNDKPPSLECCCLRTSAGRITETKRHQSVSLCHQGGGSRPRNARI